MFTGSNLHAHVLIVDDDEGARSAIVTALRRHNKLWTISEAESVDKARQLILSPPREVGPIDVVLTDLVLGNDAGAGIDVLELAKRKDPLMMVILFTAQEMRLDRFEAYRQGAFDCIEKNILGGRAWQEISIKANVAINFRQLARSQVADQKQLASLSRFLDPRVLQTAMREPKMLGVRLRTTTVVFWDIRGYARLCRRLAHHPQTLLGFINDYYGLTTEIVFRHGGMLDKFLGDVVMALFCDLTAGEPGAHDAQPAVEAALRLSATFDKLCRKWGVAELDPPLGLAAAIHTGDSLVGLLGHPDRGQLTAIGDHVNLAAQLRDRAQAGEILITAASRSYLGSGYDLRPYPAGPEYGQELFLVQGRAAG
jgi:class 3 adenylate cyclase